MWKTFFHCVENRGIRARAAPFRKGAGRLASGAGGVYGERDMKHTTPLTVRPYECDSYGHVNHAVYVNYLEHARGQFLRAAGYDYKGLLAAGFFTYIARLDISYRSPAFADDELAIESEPREMRRVSGVVHQVIRRGETVIAEADVHWCVVNGAGKPARPPEAFDLRRLAP